VKYAWIEEHRDSFDVTRMCRVLQVSRSGYCQWRTRAPSQRTLANAALDAQVAAIHAASRRSYGRNRIARGLRQQGLPVGHERVRQSLRRQGLRAVYKRPYRVTTDSNHRKPIAENVLNRRFDGWQANQAWVADITYVATDEGWLYLAAVMDLASRRIVGWSMSDRIKADLVCDALKSAYWRRKPAPGLIAHTDRGSQYASDSYRALIKDFRMTQSMSRRANLSASVRHSCPGTARHRRLDRRLLQSRENAFFDRLSDAGGGRIQPHGCVGWCTSNRGKVM
jgi:putative transposase